MSPRPDATALRRPQIIEAAITVYRKRGFAKARMDDIAEEAGVSKGLLYRYFKSKDDLTLAILTEMLRGEAAGMQALLDEDAPVPDKLLRLNDLIVGDMRQFLELAPITFEFYASAARDFAVNEALQQSYGEMRAQLRRLIEQGT
ncbi:MAG: TetR/AcrR family transcriptional regulator, partial [Anaerolineales bacterium]